MLIYNAHLRSYRELPQRYFELGVVHRHEKSGVLHGLLRVRQFTQDDAHIICAPEQLEDEIIGVIALVRDLMALFGFQYRVVISTKPAKAIGSDEAWELATNALIKAVERANLSYTINAGDGAFYGPKIDVKVTDAIGREWRSSPSSATLRCRNASSWNTWDRMASGIAPLWCTAPFWGRWNVLSGCLPSITPELSPLGSLPCRPRY